MTNPELHRQARTLPERLANRTENSGPITVCNHTVPFGPTVEKWCSAIVRIQVKVLFYSFTSSSAK